MEGYYGRVGRAHGLVYYQDETELCHVLGEAGPRVGTIRMEQVSIEGLGRSWRSDYDLESTIGTGLRRWVTDGETGLRVGSYEYRDRGLFLLHLGMRRVEIHIEGENFIFRRQSRAVGAIERREDLKKLKTFESEAFLKLYDVVYGLGEDEDMLLMMMAFPRLRFAV